MTGRFRRHMIDVEGWKPRAYKCAAGAWTIGVGHALTEAELSTERIRIDGKDVAWKNGLSDAEIDALLERDCERFFDAVDKLVKVEVDPCRREALASFAFNVGEGAFGDSTLLRRLNAGEYESVPEEMRRWVYAKGKVVKGLQNRRSKEIALWHACEDAKSGVRTLDAVDEGGGKVLGDIFRDAFGQASSIRVLMVGYGAILGLGWLIETIKTGAMPAFPSGAWEVMGVLVGGKAVQKYAER